MVRTDVLIPIVLALVLLIVAIGAVYALEVTETHEHSEHTHGITDVEYDAASDIVWSIEHEPEADENLLVGYDVSAGAVSVTEAFDGGHSLAVGDGVVYVAEEATLYEYDIETGDRREVTILSEPASTMEYDESRELLWIGGGMGTVTALDPTNGSVVMNHTEHTDGESIEDLSLQGEYVATVLTWEPEVVVYNIETEEPVDADYADAIVEEEGDNIISVHLTESGELLLGGGWDQVAMVDVETGEQLLRYTGQGHSWGISTIDYHEAQDVIVTTDFESEVVFYDTTADEVTATHSAGYDGISAADLDEANDRLWLALEAEGNAYVSGLSLAFADATPTPTPTPTPTSTPTPTPTDSPTPTDPTPTPSPTPESGGDGIPGIGILGTVLALVIVGSLMARRH